MEQFNVETASLQECVDYSVQMMVDQGGQSLAESGRCMYRSEKEGCGVRHCAIGWLLDKGNADLMDNLLGVISLVEGYDHILPHVITSDVKTLTDLQSFHDAGNMKSREVFRKRLKGRGIDVSGEWFTQWSNMGSK